MPRTSTLLLALFALGSCASVSAPPTAGTVRGPIEGAEAPAAPSDTIDPQVEALLARAFDLARRGERTELAGLLVPQFPIDVRNGRGDTLLILAAYYGQAGTVELLLERGADPDRLSDSGMTALMAAAFRGDEPLARLLVEAGADVERASPSGQTALMLAAQFANRGVVELLLEAGASPGTTDAGGRDAASLAAAHGHDALVALLQRTGTP